MHELIVRLEAATGRDPALNQDIQRAINGGRRALAVPDYTGSVDAALTLVPEGCGWLAMGNAAKVGRCPAHGATPAIALCIAALRAREAADA